MKRTPPKWPVQFLRWFCNPDFREEIEGDLYELFSEKAQSKGYPYARRTHALDMFKFFRWSNFKKPKIMKLVFNKGLWIHNFKITFRIFKKNAFFTGINVAGLVLGIISFTVLLLYYFQENSYDQFFENNKNVYRIGVNSTSDGNYLESARSPIPLQAVLKDDIPQLKEVTRLMPWPGYMRTNPENKSKESNFVFVDPNVFSLFSQRVISGNIDNALTAPFQIVITKSKAVKYFGDKDPFGEKIIYEDEYGEHEFNITAVVEDLPSNTHLDIDFYASFKSLETTIPWHNNWFYPSTFTYALLDDNVDIKEVEKGAQKLLDERGFKSYLRQEPVLSFGAMNDIHLQSNLQGEWKPNNTQINIAFFLALGIFIIIVAIINYVNLTTANSQQRSKEIGIKKSMGSQKWQLIKQFIAESVLMVSFSVLLSALTMWVLWGVAIDGLLSWDISKELLFSWEALALTISGIVLLSVIVGFYPALTATRFNPVDVINNNLSKYMSKGSQRKILVTIQFSISMCLILGTMLLIKQYFFLQDKNIGFSKNYQVTLTMIDRHDKQNYEQLKQQLLQLPFVENAAVSNTVIGVRNDFHFFPVAFPDKPELEDIEWNTLGVDEDFLNTFDIKLLEGRNFDKSIISDEQTAFLINEAGARELGWENEAVGKNMELTLYIEGAQKRNGRIVGMVEDFHFQSLYESVKPLIIYINKHQYFTDFLNLKLKNQGSLAQQIKEVEDVYAGFNPNKPMDLIFIEDEIKQKYERELTSSKIMTTFTLLSIFIASLGVFGLATYTFRRRSKEIGVRKVLGASSIHITKTLVMEYVYLIGISCIISWPAVYYFSRDWLNNFAYSTSFGPFNYVLGLILIAAITLTSSSYQILKSLRINPTEFLRDE